MTIGKDTTLTPLSFGHRLYIKAQPAACCDALDAPVDNPDPVAEKPQEPTTATQDFWGGKQSYLFQKRKSIQPQEPEACASGLSQFKI